MDAIEVGGLVVHREPVSHPLLGRAHVIEHAGRPVTACSELDWDRPGQIPTIAEPRALPPGTGTLLLNDIARRAQAAGVQTLRYAGPYPSHALFGSLLRSFRTAATVQQFTADLLDRAVRVARDELPFDFTPAPFVRSATDHGFVDIRDGAVDRIMLDTVVYDREEQTGSLAQLVGRRALLTVGVPIAHIATLDAHTQLVDGPRPIPAFPSELVGTEFPHNLIDALADGSTVHTAGPVATDVQDRLRASRIVWDDLGWRSTTAVADGFRVHVGFMALARDFSTLADRLSFHLAMIAQSTVLAAVMASRR